MSETDLNPINLKALDKIAQYLAIRDHSEKELVEKLQKNFTEEVILWALLEAKKNKWLLPPEELAQRVADSLHRKNKGITYIQSYLKKKGLPSIETDLEVEVEKGKKLLTNKFKKYCGFTYEEKVKAHRFLTYRGFDNTTIQKIINS